MSHEVFERISSDGVKLFLQAWHSDGVPKGVVCLVHGLGEHSGRYEHWARLLNQAEYSVMTYDLRGHGKSGGQKGHVSSFDDYIQDTDALMEEARSRYPGSKLYLYGHSLGGLIVNYYVLRKKPALSGVIVTALSNKTSLQEQKLKVIMAKVLGSLIPKVSISTGLIPATISQDPDVVARYINDPLVHNQATLAWGKSALDTIDWSEQHASEWTLPVLFMHGELDKLGYAEGSLEFAKKIKGDCTIKIWPGMFHEIHNEPDKIIVFDYLQRWLDEH